MQHLRKQVMEAERHKQVYQGLARRCRTRAPWILLIVEGLSIHFQQVPVNLNFDGDVHVGSNNMGPSHIKAFGYFWFEITADINGWFEITTDHFLEAR
jgi:hypothetical protein